MLSIESRRFLLRSAREAIAAVLHRGKSNAQSASLIAPPEVKQARCGVFVSLHTQPEGKPRPVLRGCIGHIRSRNPLDHEIVAVAEQAAFADRRFEPMRCIEELDRTLIEVSLLSPFEPVDQIDEIEPGRHGVYIEIGNRAGLLLPQVALEHGWNRETFLRHLCIKAGRRDECWKDPQARLYRFTAEVFDENSPGMR